MKTQSSLVTLPFLFFFFCGGVIKEISAGTPCRQIPLSPDTCCQIPKHAREAEVVEECFKKFGEQTKREQAQKDAAERGCCVAECIMNGTDHTELSEAKMVEVELKEAEEMGMTEDWAPVIKAAAKMCSEEQTKQAARLDDGFKLAPVDPKDQVCHPKYVFTLACTMREYVLNCPAKYYKDTKECTELKEFLNTCDL